MMPNFVAQYFGSPSEGDGTLSLAEGDLNGDGLLDVALCFLRQITPPRPAPPYWIRKCEIYQNDGAGTLSAIVSFGQIRSDQPPDIIVHGSVVYWNDGLGGFGVTTTKLGSSGGNSALGDLNGDSALDIVQGNVVYWNNELGGFVVTTTLAGSSGTHALGDLKSEQFYKDLTCKTGRGLARPLQMNPAFAEAMVFPADN
jgi:hypothetical protein